MDDGTTDEAKGRVKKAAGELTGDKDLKNEGRVEKAESTLKDKVDDAGDAVKKLLHRDKD